MGGTSAPSRLRPDKRRAILDAAARIFMRDGFGLAGVDDIVAESGVSKRTLYAHFESKEALFEAIVQELCDALMTPLRDADIGQRDPRDALIDLGRTFLDVILAPQGVNLYRMVIAEAPRFPELGRIFFEAGHEPAARLLSDYISAKAVEGAFRDIDSRKAAEGFFQLLCGFMHERALLCLDTAFDRDEIEAQLSAATDILLGGIERSEIDD